MRIGLVLEAFLDRPLDDVLDFLAASAPQVTDLEVGVGGFAPTPHCDVPLLLADGAARERWRAGIEARGFRVSALNVSGNPLDPDPELGQRHDRELRDAIRLAPMLGVDRVVAMAGCPAGVPGDRTAHFDAGGWLPYLAGIYERQWGDAVLPYWQEVSALARSEHPGLMICLELHPGSCAYNVETCERVAGRRRQPRRQPRSEPPLLAADGPPRGRRAPVADRPRAREGRRLQRGAARR